MAKDILSGVLPFLISGGSKKAALRGRLVRIDDAVSEILARHDYPMAVSELLAESLVLSSCLASTMDYDGVFSLQAKGDGDVRLLLADVTSAGALRGYAQASADFASADLGAPAPLLQLMGAGYLSFTVDQGEQGRYQGIVALEDVDLTAAALRYFYQSEQLDTALILAASPPKNPNKKGGQSGKWHAAALMLQRIPDEGGNDEAIISTQTPQSHDDIWHTALTLMATCSRNELLDPDLAPADLLYRLFNEFDITASPVKPIHDQCRCSPERIHLMLEGLPEEEKQSLAVDNVITVSCEFCKNQRSVTI